MSKVGRTWHRKPNLSDKPHPERGMYWFSYRNSQGKPRRFWCTEDRNESQDILDQWHLDRKRGIHYSSILSREQAIGNPLAPAPDAPPPKDKPATYSFAHLIDAYKAFLKNRRKPAGTVEHLGGLICGRQLDSMLLHTDHIAQWFRDRYGRDACRAESMHRLMTSANHCYQMLLSFQSRYKGSSQFDKHRQRFWDLARFSRNEPGFGPLPFIREDVPPIKNPQKRKKRGFPSIETLQQILGQADLQQRLWIWMAIGLGFHQSDLGRATPGDFKKGDKYILTHFDLARRKTNEAFERSGKVPPLVQAYLKKFLEANPRKDDELLFVTKFGNPYAYDVDKTNEELENGTKTRGPSKTSTKRTDNFGQEWRALKRELKIDEKKWPGGDFYGLRHLGATVFGSRDGANLMAVRKFLGHAERSLVADDYLHNVPLEAEDLIEWLKAMLDSSDTEAWTKPVKKSAK